MKTSVFVFFTTMSIRPPNELERDFTMLPVRMQMRFLLKFFFLWLNESWLDANVYPVHDIMRTYVSYVGYT